MGIDVTAFFLGDEGRAELSGEVIELLQSGFQIRGKLSISKHEACKRFIFYEMPVGWNKEAVHTDRRQIGVCLSGQLRLKTSNGQTKDFFSGDVWRLNEKNIDGITATVVGEEPVKCLIVQLD